MVINRLYFENWCTYLRLYIATERQSQEAVCIVPQFKRMRHLKEQKIDWKICGAHQADGYPKVRTTHDNLGLQTTADQIAFS